MTNTLFVFMYRVLKKDRSTDSKHKRCLYKFLFFVSLSFEKQYRAKTKEFIFSNANK